MKKVASLGLFVLVLVFALIGTRGIAKTQEPADSSTLKEGKVSALPVVGSAEHLRTLLKEMQASQQAFAERTTGAPQATMAPAASSALLGGNGAAATAKSAAPDVTGYSETNLQVEGVDEADRIKTDGKYLFEVNAQKVYIVALSPANEMRVVNSLDWRGKGFSPLELYVDSKYLVIVGHAQEVGINPAATGAVAQSKTPTGAVVQPTVPVGPGAAPRDKLWPQPAVGTTKVLIYDRTDLAHLNQLREVELEGGYVSSRKVGTALYFATNQFIDYPRIMSGDGESGLPFYRDSFVQDQPIRVDYSQVHYFPGAVEANYFMVAGLDLDKPEQPLSVQTYLGSGRNIYASAANMYVAVSKYKQAATKASGSQPPGITPLASSQPLPSGAPASTAFQPNVQAPQVTTVVYKFALAAGRPEYQGQGEVPGRLLNQFSMDEYQGNFRLATTEDEGGFVGGNTFRNAVYILDKDMKLSGKVENIAPGERIYSVRFIAGRAYMVTFQMVDPLFVLDMSDPQNPKVLGELKMPGYSDYLQPYDENHILGFGKEATVQTVNQGGQQQERAFYLGMKVTLFDVRDVSHPVELFKETIGDRGTDSEVLRNHKALLFDREKKILAFPVNVFQVKDQAALPGGMPAYGSLTFQGLYVYQLDLAGGFKLKGKITHMSANDSEGMSKYRYSGNRNIERAIYIGDTLYAISPSLITAHNLQTVAEIGRLEIPSAQ